MNVRSPILCLVLLLACACGDDGGSEGGSPPDDDSERVEEGGDPQPDPAPQPPPKPQIDHSLADVPKDMPGVRSAERADAWPVFRRVHGDATHVRLSPSMGPCALVEQDGTLFIAGRLTAKDRTLWIVHLEKPPTQWQARTVAGEHLQLLATGLDARSCVLRSGAPPAGSACAVFAAPPSAEEIMIGDVSCVPRVPLRTPTRGGAIDETELPAPLASLERSLTGDLSFRAALPKDAPAKIAVLRSGEHLLSFGAIDLDGVRVPLLMRVHGDTLVAGRLEVGRDGNVFAKQPGFVPLIQAKTGSMLPAVGGASSLYVPMGGDR